MTDRGKRKHGGGDNDGGKKKKSAYWSSVRADRSDGCCSIATHATVLALGDAIDYYSAYTPGVRACHITIHTTTVPACRQNARASLPYGSRGFLISCLGGKEHLAAREATNLLTEVRATLLAFS